MLLTLLYNLSYINFIETTKSPSVAQTTWSVTHILPVSEISMNKNPIQSNLPEFNASRMISQRLYQHPVKAPRNNSLAQHVIAWLIPVLIFASLGYIAGTVADHESAKQVEAISGAVGGDK